MLARIARQSRSKDFKHCKLALPLSTSPWPLRSRHKRRIDPPQACFGRVRKADSCMIGASGGRGVGAPWRVALKHAPTPDARKARAIVVATRSGHLSFLCRPIALARFAPSALLFSPESAPPQSQTELPLSRRDTHASHWLRTLYPAGPTDNGAAPQPIERSRPAAFRTDAAKAFFHFPGDIRTYSAGCAVARGGATAINARLLKPSAAAWCAARAARIPLRQQKTRRLSLPT